MGRRDEPCTFFECPEGFLCALKIDEEEPLKRLDPRSRCRAADIAAALSSHKEVLSADAGERSDRAGDRVPEAASPSECPRGLEMEPGDLLADPDALKRAIRVRIEEPQDIPPTHGIGFVQSVEKWNTPWPEEAERRGRDPGGRSGDRRSLTPPNQPP